MFSKKKRINVENKLNLAEKMIIQGKAKKAYSYMEEISDYLYWFIKQNNPLEHHILKQIDHHIRNTKDFTKEDIDKIKVLFREYFSTGVAYLIRHSEPDPASYGENAKRDLSKKGVKEIYDLGKLLSNEVLLCPFNVKIHIFYSPKTRTKKSAKYAEKVMRRTVERFGKSYELEFEEDNLLYYDVMQDLAGVPGASDLVKKIRKGESTKEDLKSIKKYFELWITKYSGSKNVAEDMKRLLDKSREKSPDFNIYLYFTHEMMIATLTYHHLGLRDFSAWPMHSEYVKEKKGRLFYRGKWL